MGRNRLGFESLERRALMAGDVFVAIEGELLRVEGHNLANQVTLAQSSTGDLVVSGQNGTTINGLPSVRFARPVINAAEIRMEGGDDAIVLRGLRVANDLFVDLGAGNDRLTSPATAPISVGANALIYGEAGNDTVQLNRAKVFEDLYIDGGIGALTATITNSSIDKSMAIVGDEANDSVSVVGSTVGLDLSIETKGGSDTVRVSQLQAFNLLINTDSNAAAGRDVVNISNASVVEDIGIFTGAGDDVVRMTGTTSNKVTVSLDQGNDRLEATNVVAATDIIFEGGAGIDTLLETDVFASIFRDYKEFERIL
ncbi:MAG: hypothetical protein ACK5YR_05720 [Pirellula sp.]